MSGGHLSGGTVDQGDKCRGKPVGGTNVTTLIMTLSFFHIKNSTFIEAANAALLMFLCSPSIVKAQNSEVSEDVLDCKIRAKREARRQTCSIPETPFTVEESP